MNFSSATAIIDTLHKIAAHPWIYDRIQSLAGQEQCVDRIARQTASLRAETVVDIGGGTGNLMRLWSTDCRYVCLDIELPKLQGFRAKVPAGLAVLSDATHMSIATRCADAVVLVAVMHHLTDKMLDDIFQEALRVLKRDGRLIFLDPVLNRRRWMGRALWRLDRGSFPRTAQELHERLEARFKIVHWEKFAIYHEYVFGIGMRP
jgi:ubiquinone/menaquinone biosynthesis C-methylase UbiE